MPYLVFYRRGQELMRVLLDSIAHHRWTHLGGRCRGP